MKTPYIATQQQQIDTTPKDTSRDIDIESDMQAEVPSTPMPSNLVENTNDNVAQHNLKDMLERFVLVDTFKWSSSDSLIPMHLDPSNYIAGAPSYLKQYLLPQAILDNSELHRQKLNNFMLLNADVEIEVKANSTPFQQGALLKVFFPKSLATTKFRAQGNEFLAAVTTTPHRVLHLEEGNSMKLTIPYANILDMIDLTDTNNTYGVLNIYALAPLAASESPTEVDVSVRMRFVNLNVSVATDRSIMSQAKYLNLEKQRIDTLLNTPGPTRIPGLVAQSSEGESEGPVTRIANAIGTIGETLAGAPVIGTAARLVGWFARGVAGVASVFGWSKPIDLTMPRAFYNKPACYMGNVEGKDASHVLAQISDNAIDTSSINPSNEDELALSLITGRPNYIGRYSVSKQDFTANKLLFSWEVAPWNSLMQQQHANGQDFALGGVSFAYLMYQYWRGGMDYCLSCVKTAYHSGRLVAVYFPNRTRTEVPAVFSQEMTTNNHIIYDLVAKDGDSNSLSMPFSVPYTSNEPWKLTLAKNQNGLYDASTFKTHIGVIAVYCLTELVCPPTVNDKVTFLLQHRAGKGFDVAVPKIQLQGGFAVDQAPQNPSVELASAINATLPSDMGVVYPAAVGDTPNFDDFGYVYINQDNDDYTTWPALEGVEIPLIDDYYTNVVVNLAFDPANFSGGEYVFNFTVQDGALTSVNSNKIQVITAYENQITVDITATSVAKHLDIDFHGLRAQSSDGAAETFTSNTELAHGSEHDVTRYTTGEYCKSLRPLMKRFVKVAEIKGGEAVTRQPAEFDNYESGDMTQPIGNRSVYVTDGTTSRGAYMPESWLSLISYLYRFCGGSTRTKTFIPWNGIATSSLDMIDTFATSIGRPPTEPAFVQAGVVNNAVECSIPYYGQYKARTIGDQLRGRGSAQRFVVTGTTDKSDYYEAAGDDFSFWYLVGPPVMRPVDVNVTSIPTLSLTD